MKYFKYILISILSILISGCKKFVELEPPQNLLVTESAFIKAETAIAAMTAIYAGMVDNTNFAYQLSLYSGLAGDELKNYSNTEVNIQAYTDNFLAINNGVGSSGLWNTLYGLIYQSNSVIEGVEKSTTLTPAVKKQLLAEAHLTRAWCHFYLVNLWGDVPLITSTNYEINRLAVRTPTRDVYAKVIEDLSYAKTNLNVGYVNLNTFTTGEERIRPNSYTASALLARVYLYTKDYENAAKEATIVISDKINYDIVSLDQVFKKNNKEAIWQLMKPTPAYDVNTYEGNFYILTSRPSTGGTRSSTVSAQLYNAFDATDLRRTAWIKKITSGGVDYYFPFKYQVRTSPEVTEYSTLIRLAELFLIRAEARAMTRTNLNEAIDDLDVIRNRAGIPLIKTTNPTIAKEDFLAVVSAERRKELFTEYGHRWMDMKRTGTINQIMSIVAPEKGTTWNETKQLWPIPQQTLDTGPNLRQNPGYD